MDLFLSLWRYLGEGFGLSVIIACVTILLFLAIRRFHSRKDNMPIGAIFFSAARVLIIAHGISSQIAIPLSLRTYGPGDAPNLLISNVLHFLSKFDAFERVEAIARDPADVPSTIKYSKVKWKAAAVTKHPGRLPKSSATLNVNVGMQTSEVL